MDAQDRTILQRFFLGVVLVVVIGVVVWALFMRHTDKKAPTAAKNTSQQTAGVNANAQKTTNTAAKSAAPANQTPSQLANTGPGNVLALVAATSVMAALGHYAWRRKFAAFRA